MHTKTAIRNLRRKALEERDHELVAICDLALDGRVSEEAVASLGEAQRERLADWDATRAYDHVNTLEAPASPEVPEPR